MKHFSLAILFMLSFCISQAQETPISKPGQSFIAEVGGPGVLFSVNYDTRFKKSIFGLGGRIGVGFTSGYKGNTVYDSVYNYYYTINSKDVSVLTVPMQLNYLFGKAGSTSALEIGAGATYVGKYADAFGFSDDNPNKSKIYGTASFMYRRMPRNGGFSWRVGFTPLISNGLIQPSGAASVGYNF